LEGYISKFEHGLLTGPHHHWLFFLDGSKVQSDRIIAQKMGEIWVNITASAGRYYNCNAAYYYARGIGKVHYSDIETIQTLTDVALPYLLKPDNYVRVSGQRQNINRGEMPNLRAKKVGRPRLKNS